VQGRNHARDQVALLRRYADVGERSIWQIFEKPASEELSEEQPQIVVRAGWDAVRETSR